MPPRGEEFPHQHGMNRALRQNISSLTGRELEEARHMPLSQRMAQRITAFTGSMRFVFLHLVAQSASDVIAALSRAPDALGAAARRRVTAGHGAATRARELEHALTASLAGRAQGRRPQLHPAD